MTGILYRLLSNFPSLIIFPFASLISFCFFSIAWPCISKSMTTRYYISDTTNVLDSRYIRIKYNLNKLSIRSALLLCNCGKQSYIQGVYSPEKPRKPRIFRNFVWKIKRILMEFYSNLGHFFFFFFQKLCLIILFLYCNHR